MYEMDFGLRLKKCREKKGMKQVDVARRLGISSSLISSYERNVKTPSLEVFHSLCVLYCVSSDYVLGIERKISMPINNLSPKQYEILENLVDEIQRMNEKIGENQN